MSHPESSYRPNIEEINVPKNPENERNVDMRAQVVEWLNTALVALEEAVKQDPDSKSEQRFYLDECLSILIPDLEYNNDFSLNRDYLKVLKKIIKIIESSRSVKSTDDEMKDDSEFSISIQPLHLLYKQDWDNGFVLFKNNTINVSGLNNAQEGEIYESANDFIPIKGYKTSNERLFTKTVIDDLLSDPPITVDAILNSWSKEKIRDFLYQKESISSQLRQMYVIETKSVELLSEIIVFLNQYSENDIVGEILSRTQPQDIRKSLHQYRRFTCSEAIKDIQQKLFKKDTSRYELHRKIEGFCEVFEGKSKVATAAALELSIRGQKKSIEILEKVTMIFPDEQPYSDRDFIDIQLGIGVEYTSVHYDSAVPAAKPSYESFISSERSRNDDIALADKIIVKLKETLPTLQVSNDLNIRGSFHEQFAGTGIKITRDSVERLVDESEEDLKDLIDEIKEIVQEEIQQEKK